MNKYERGLLILAASLTIFRLIYISSLPLVPQEAYYWKFAKSLSLSYYDHPPMAAYTIAFFTWLGGDSPFFVRLGAVLYSLGLIVLIYQITRMLFDSDALALRVSFAISFSILFAIGASIITPDVPLLFFWALIVYFLIKLRQSGHSGWWYAAGASLGCAMLSKYTAVLLPAGVLLYLIFSRDQRKWLKSPHPYLAVALAVLVFSPVIIWNYQNEWASFAFQSSRRFGEMKSLRLDYFFQLIGSQLGMLTPYLFLVLVVGLTKAAMAGFRGKSDNFLFLVSLALPIVLLFTLSSFRSLVKMNWLAPAYVTGMIASFGWLYSDYSDSARRLRRWFAPGMAFAVILVVIVHAVAIFPLVPIRKGDTWTGWQRLANHVQFLQEELAEEAFVFSHEYKIPSQLSFYAQPRFSTHASEIYGGNGLHYQFWTNTNALLGKDAIFVTSNANRFKDMKRLAQHFDNIEQLKPLRIEHNGRLFRAFYLYLCKDYRGLQQNGN